MEHTIWYYHTIWYFDDDEGYTCNCEIGEDHDSDGIKLDS